MTHRFRLAVAAAWIRGGGIVAHPTEAVYGLACDPDNEASLARMLALKGRPSDRGFILIGADAAQLTPYIDDPDEALLRRLGASWPGPVTWVVDAAADVSPTVTGGRGSVAVRVPGHATARALCRMADTALVSTSANLSGRPPCRTALAVHRSFGRNIDYVLGGATGGALQPSEIRDARSGTVLRPA